MYRPRLQICLLICLAGKGVWCQIDNFYVSQFSDSATLETCRSDLLEIDENGDMKLDRDEYAAFLQLQSGNQMSGDFQSLPFRLESIYFSAACMCSVVDPNDNQCCLNGNDHIPLDTTQSPLIDPFLDFLCHNVQVGLIAEGYAVVPIATTDPSANPSSAPSISPSDSPTNAPSVIPTALPSELPSGVPTLGPSNFPSDTPSEVPSASPSLLPTNEPTKLPSSNPTRPPSIVPTLNPSSFPSDRPSSFPTLEPSSSPSDLPSTTPTGAPNVSPTGLPTTNHPSSTPTLNPSVVPTSFPSVAPSNAPTGVPVDTLCVDFQYVVRNQVGLDAEDVFNEENNSVLQGLRLATRNITIEILNGTYPERRLLSHAAHTSIDTELLSDHQLRRPKSGHLRKLQQKLKKKETEPNLMEQPEHWRRRKLAYYTDDIPVTINSVTDNPLCVGSAQNPRIMCAIISSTVCVVLEEEDDPDEVRALMIAGLRQAVDSGDFLRRIPAEDLQMNS